MYTSRSTSKHSFILQLFEAMPKRGRLQCISWGFHPLDVWTVVLSDSPWTANRRSLFEAFSVSALFGPGCCCRCASFPFAPVYPKRAGWRTRALVVVFWLWSWLAAVFNLFVLNLLRFISVCLYPKRADCRTRTYRRETKKTLPRRPGHVAPRGAFSCRCANAAILNATS